MIIDFHTHVFPDKIAARTVAALEKNGNATAYSDGTASGLINSLRRAGADVAVNLPVLTSPTQFESITRFAGEICNMPPCIQWFANVVPLAASDWARSFS